MNVMVKRESYLLYLFSLVSSVSICLKIICSYTVIVFKLEKFFKQLKKFLKRMSNVVSKKSLAVKTTTVSTKIENRIKYLQSFP